MKQNESDYLRLHRELTLRDEMVQEKIKELKRLKEEYYPNHWMDQIVFEIRFFMKRLFVFGPFLVCDKVALIPTDNNFCLSISPSI